MVGIDGGGVCDSLLSFLLLTCWLLLNCVADAKGRLGKYGLLPPGAVLSMCGESAKDSAASVSNMHARPSLLRLWCLVYEWRECVHNSWGPLGRGLCLGWCQFGFEQV